VRHFRKRHSRLKQYSGNVLIDRDSVIVRQGGRHGHSLSQPRFRGAFFLGLGLAARFVLGLAFTRCWGGLFATTSTARSKRAHASGCSSGSFVETGLAMNMPRTKPIVRYKRPRPKKKQRTPQQLGGIYSGGINNDQFALAIGRILAQLPHIEEEMIRFMALLLGDETSPARQVFRALNSEDARVKVMRALLEQAQHNDGKGPEFDEVIDLFVEIKTRRNAYAHGLWWTHEETGRMFLAEASTNESVAYFVQREIKLGELNATINRMDELRAKLRPIIFPAAFAKDGSLRPSPKTLPPPPDEAGS
jgi:hypothetical protein